MTNNNKLRETDIKNLTSYFFDRITNINNINPQNIKVD